MGTAKRIKKIELKEGNIATLYELEPPLEGNKYVVVSSTIVPFAGAETFVFPADKTGKVKDWTELSASIRGTLSHTPLLNKAGYEVVDND